MDTVWINDADVWNESYSLRLYILLYHVLQINMAGFAGNLFPFLYFCPIITMHYDYGQEEQDE